MENSLRLNVARELLTEFDSHDWNCMRDVVYNATGLLKSKREVELMFQFLPRSLQLDALKFGMSDTEWRDQLYVYLRDQLEN